MGMTGTWDAGSSAGCDIGPVGRVDPAAGDLDGSDGRASMSLIPTFAVPLLPILHMICIAQARGWPAPERSGFPKQVPSGAVQDWPVSFKGIGLQVICARTPRRRWLTAAA